MLIRVVPRRAGRKQPLADSRRRLRAVDSRHCRVADGCATTALTAPAASGAHLPADAAAG